MSQYASSADVQAYCATLNLDQLTINTVLGSPGMSGYSGVSGYSGYSEDTVINNICAAQSSFIDSYLCGRYATSITGPAGVMTSLKVHCIRLSLYVLFQGRNMAEQYHSLLDDRDITLEWLRGVAAGRYAIPGQAPPVVVPTLDSVGLTGGSDVRVFGPGAPGFSNDDRFNNSRLNVGDIWL